MDQEGGDVHGEEQPKPWNILLSQWWSMIHNKWEKKKKKMQFEEITPVWSVRGWRAVLGSPVHACANWGGRVLTLLTTPADILDTDAEAGTSCFRLENASESKPSAYNAETRVRSLSQEDPLEKEMATYSSILAWKIPWTLEPGRLQSMGSQRVGHDVTERLHFHLTVLQVLYMISVDSFHKPLT